MTRGRDAIEKRVARPHAENRRSIDARRERRFGRSDFRRWESGGVGLLCLTGEHSAWEQQADKGERPKYEEPHACPIANQPGTVIEALRKNIELLRQPLYHCAMQAQSVQRI